MDLLDLVYFFKWNPVVILLFDALRHTFTYVMCSQELNKISYLLLLFSQFLNFQLSLQLPAF